MFRMLPNKIFSQHAGTLLGWRFFFFVHFCVSVAKKRIKQKGKVCSSRRRVQKKAGNCVSRQPLGNGIMSSWSPRGALTRENVLSQTKRWKPRSRSVAKCARPSMEGA